MTPLLRRVGVLTAALALVCALAGCGSSQPITGPSVPEVTDIVILFSNTLSVGEKSFFSFVIDQPRTVEITLASTMADVTGPATPTPLSLGIGTPGGTDCVVSNPAGTVTPALLPQISVELQAGTYCARVQDPGTMSGPLTFAVRIVILAGRGELPSPGTDLFATSLAVQGATSRSVQASQAGVMLLTLQGLGGGASQLGIGIGIPRTDGSGCFLTQSVVTAAGATPQIAASVAPGRYCVRVFDPGVLANPVTFTLQIDFP